MSKEPPTLYSVSKTFMWFAIISIVLFGSLVAIIVTDHTREWRVWQRQFTDLKAKKIQEELTAAEKKIDKQKLESLTQNLAQAKNSLSQHRAQINALKKEIASLDTKILQKRAHYQNLKQYLDSARYYYEEAEHKKDPKAPDYQAKMTTLEPETEIAKREVEALEQEKEGKESKLGDFSSKEKTLQKDLDKLLEESRRLEKRLQTVKATPVKDLLNAPMLDFLAPTQKIQQVVLDNLYDDYHFAKVQKVDRCTTCHLGIDQKGFENAPQPFRTHPKLEMFVGADSKHSIEKFGCTTCHAGNGHSVTFKDSAHTPQNEIQKKEWVKKYGWAMLEKWEDPMLPLNHIEASCAKCHQGVAEVPKADKLNKGRKLAENAGCFTCHKIEGFQDRWRTGPSLQRIDSKVNKDWILRWLHDPKSFRDSTRMPRVFNLSNTSSPEDQEKNKAAILAITTYLLKNSEAFETSEIPVEGDKQSGEELVKTVGCLGCHSVAGLKVDTFAPELTGLGSKVKSEWLYAWLKNPKHYLKETRMPSFRLTDKEAADITSYLISLKNTSFEQLPVPQASQEVVRQMVMHYLEETMRHSEAEGKLAAMSEEDSLLYLGKKMISQQGCYSCHTIKGFEDTKPIATELTTEGQKNIHQFDFGLLDIEKTRQAWIFQKLKEPRIFDHGKVKSYYEKLRMPDFGFTDEEAEAITTFVLSLREEPIPLEMKKNLDIKEAHVEKGRLLLAKFNCNGCHTLDGQEGTLRDFVEDKGQAPPILDGEGAKVQEVWLHHFLREPTTIRPWLTYRMPTFGFDDEELTSWVLYFTYLDNQEVSYRGLEVPPTTLAKVEAGKKVFQTFQCVKCHQVNTQSSAMGASFLAPDLKLTKIRLKPSWVAEWIKDPQPLQRDTMMPTFFAEGQSPLEDVLGGSAQQQIEAIRDYLYLYDPDSETPASNPETKNPVANKSVSGLE